MEDDNDFISNFRGSLEKQSKEDIVKQRRRNMKPQVLVIEKDDGDKVKSHTKRVQCEAIDFDWIFEGDNMENMIKILND